LYLLQFDFILKHIPGKSIRKVDRLSRRPDWQKGVKNNNENQILIKLEWIKRTETLVKENNLKDRIKKVQKVVKAVKELKKAGIKILRNEE